MKKVFTVDGEKLEFNDVTVKINGVEQSAIRIKILATKEEMITLDTMPFPENSDDAREYIEDCYYCRNIRKDGGIYICDDEGFDVDLSDCFTASRQPNDIKKIISDYFEFKGYDEDTYGLTVDEIVEEYELER